MMRIILIAHNLRSTHNVGSLLRTAEGLGITCVYFTGYTPHPSYPADNRLLHITQKLDKQIQKTALGAEHTQAWKYESDIQVLLKKLKSQGYTICALEQSSRAIPLPSYLAPTKIALIVGREVEGIEPEVLAAAENILEIPMSGQKESFNVAQAAAIALYHLRFFGNTQT